MVDPNGRGVPGALVSAPLRWSEVTRRLRLDRYTIRSMPERLRKLDEDPMLDVLGLKPDLPAMLARLAEKMKGS